jgi:hypothetical protein
VKGGLDGLFFESTAELGDSVKTILEVIRVVRVGVTDSHALRFLKGVARGDEGTGGLDHPSAEVVGVDVVVVVDECDGASLRLHKGEIWLGLAPVREYLEVLADNATAALEDLILVSKSVSSDFLVKQTTGDEIIVAVTE